MSISSAWLTLRREHWRCGSPAVVACAPARCASASMLDGIRRRTQSAALTVRLGPGWERPQARHGVPHPLPPTLAWREQAQCASSTPSCRARRRARERFGVVGVGIARITGDPSSTRVWQQGAQGEAKVATRLGKLLEGSGVHLLHDRRLIGHGRANIDHLAVGPGGVTVIDAKAVHGEILVESVGGLFSARQQLLRVAGRDRTRLVRGVQKQAEVVRERLADSGLHTVEVRCALCFVNTDGLPWLRRLELDGVTLDGPKRVAKLACRPGSSETPR